MTEFEAAVQLCQIIKTTGRTAVFAGGCVRDMLLGRPFSDIDIATDCPDDVLNRVLLFHLIVPKPVGKAFGVILAKVWEKEYAEKGHTFEIARFRKDINCDGRHPESVQFCSMEEDSQRRDFTINAVFYDPIAEKYYDFVNGIDDIKNKRLVFVGNPEDRIREDYLRVLRYIRFYARGFKTTKKERQFVDSFAEEMFKAVSPERIRMEFMDKILPSLKDSRVFKEFPKVFNLLFDGVPDKLLLVNQNPKWHPEGDVWTHTLKVVDFMLDNKLRTPLLLLSAILHDFGKLTDTFFDNDTKNWRSPGHENTGTSMARDWMIKYKFSNAEIAYVEWLVLNHMKLHYSGLKKSTLKRLIFDGDITGLMVLTLCDCMGASGNITEFLRYEEKIKEILSEGTNTRPPPILTGFDLICAGMKPGRHFGIILSKAYDRQLEDGAVTKEELLKEALKNETGSRTTIPS